MPQTSENRRVVPQDPLFDPGALTLRSGMPARASVAGFDFFWARNALFHGLRALGIEKGQKVLLPAYLCQAAIQSIDYFGAQIEFYAIRRNCVADWSDIESKVRSNVRAIMAVHYFGIPCEIEKFQAICSRHGLFLVEDCAHVLEGIPNQYRLGEWGDFSIFSPRKYLPVFDGGRLLVNRPGTGFRVQLQFESPLFTARVVKNLLNHRKPPEAWPEKESPVRGALAEESRGFQIMAGPESRGMSSPMTFSFGRGCWTSRCPGCRGDCCLISGCRISLRNEERTTFGWWNGCRNSKRSNLCASGWLTMWSHGFCLSRSAQRAVPTWRCVLWGFPRSPGVA